MPASNPGKYFKGGTPGKNETAPGMLRRGIAAAKSIGGMVGSKLRNPGGGGDTSNKTGQGGAGPSASR